MSHSFTPVVCRATIAQRASALQFGGDGAHVTFDIPESDKITVLPLTKMQNLVLRLTIEVDPQFAPKD